MKKGFTLVELLAVIAIMALLIGFAIPSVGKVSKNINEREYKDKIENIKTAAIFYAQDNIESFPITITVENLLSTEYFEPDVENGVAECNKVYGCVEDPRNSSFLNDLEINITKNNNVILATINE